MCIKKAFADLRAEIKDKDNKLIMKYSLLYTFITGMVAHAFEFLNLNPSHDSLYSFFFNSHGAQIALGRVFEPFYRKITASGVVMPWSAGCIALLWIALAVFFTAKIFNLTGKKEIFILAGIFATNKTVTALAATYIPWLCPNMFALFAAALAVFFWTRFIREYNFVFLLLGSVCITASLGLYQSYLAVAVLLIMIYSVLALLTNEKAKDVIKNGLGGVAMIGIGGAIYYACMRIICKATNINLSEGGYNNVTNAWNNKEPLTSRISECYKGVLKSFLSCDSSAYRLKTISIINIVIIALCVILIVYAVFKNRVRIPEICLAAVLCVCLPFGANAIRLLNTNTHHLMYFAFYIIYLIPVLVLSALKKSDGAEKIKPVGATALILILFILFNNVQTANLVYVEKQLQYDATMSLVTNMVDNIEQQEGYIEGETPVVIIGTPDSVLLPLPEKSKISAITGAQYNSPITYSYPIYIQHIMQRKMLIQDAGTLTENETVKNMPVYPQEGYISTVDGVVVVKLANS